MMEFSLVRTLSVAGCLVGSILVLSHVKALTRRSRYERVAEFFLPKAPSSLDPITHLKSYQGKLLRPVFEKLSKDAKLSSLSLAFRKAVGGLNVQYAAIGLAVLALVAIITKSATSALFAGILSPLLLLVLKSLRIYQDESARIRELKDGLPLYIEQISSFVASGLSIQSALDRYPKTIKGPWSVPSLRISAEIRRGANPGRAMGLVVAQYRLDDFGHLIRLLEANYSSPELPALLDEQSRSLRRRQQLELTEKLSKRAQAVWIPVSVAALVPGIIFVMIPFVSALHAFGGI